MPRVFDHVDLRVVSLTSVSAFYRALLPALGFSVRVDIEGWLQFEAGGEGPREFFGITEDSQHMPNANRIAFWADSIARVDELSKLLPAIGAVNIEGPGYESDYYYAVFSMILLLTDSRFVTACDGLIVPNQQSTDPTPTYFTSAQGSRRAGHSCVSI
jgi:hypothetical protein